MRLNRIFAVTAISGIFALSVAGQASGAVPSAKVQVDPESTGLTISVDSLTPVDPREKDTLQLSGTVTNTSDEDIDGVNVELRISQDQLTNRSQLAKIADGEETPNTRSVSDGTTSIKPKLAPGANAPWSLKLPVANLGLGNSGVYGLRVDATAQQNSERTDSTQTFLPWFPNPKTVKPTKVVWLWPLSDWPNQNANQVFLNERTPQEITSTGRLSRLLDLGIAARAQAEWIVDPQVLAAVTGMTDGYQVAGPQGVAVPGGTAQPAIDWLAKARSGLNAAAVNASAYAIPDVTAMTRERMTQEVVQATAASTETVTALLGRPVTTNLGWPPGTRTDSKTLSLLQKSGVRTVVLDRGALTPSENDPGNIGSAVIRTESGPLSAVLTDRVLSSSLGNSASSAQDALLARQRFLAETGVITTSAPDSDRIVAVGPDPRWDPNSSVVADLLGALRTSEWMRSATLAQLLAATPKDVPRSLAPMSAGARRSGLSASYLRKIQEAQDNLDVFASILADPGQLTEKYSTALLRATSGAWRVDRDGGNQLIASIDKELGDEMGRVRVLSGGVKNFSSETGEIPITISNDLPVPVTVGMTLTGDPPIRLSAQKFAPITIPPNRKVSTQITAKVRGNGELPVKVQLTNPAGTPYGEPSEVTLRSSAYANAATWVVAVAFGLLTLLLLINSVRRRRQRIAEAAAAKSPPADETDVDDTSTPAGPSGE